VSDALNSEETISFSFSPSNEGQRGRCPVPCDDDCDAVCHASHDPTHRKEHWPEDCPAVERSELGPDRLGEILRHTRDAYSYFDYHQVVRNLREVAAAYRATRTELAKLRTWRATLGEREVQWATRTTGFSRIHPDDEWLCRRRAALKYGEPHELVQRDVYPTAWRVVDDRKNGENDA